MKGFGKKLSLIFFSIVFCFLVFEIALRIVGISYMTFYEVDSTRGYRLMPLMRGRWIREGDASVSINAHGFRDEPRTVEKPEQVFRIAVLGDSFTQAFQVNLNQSYPYVVQKNLQNCSKLENKKIEVMNFGVSGYGTALEYLTLEENVWPFSPDLIVLQTFLRNDVSNNSLALEKDDSRPYFVIENDRLKLDNSFLESEKYKTNSGDFRKSWVSVVNSLRFLQVINEAYSQISRWFNPYVSGFASHGDTVKQSLAEPSTTEWKKAWEVTERLLEKFHKTVREHEIKLVVMNASYGLQVHPDKQFRENLKQEHGIEDLNYLDHRLQRIGRDLDLPVLLTAPFLLEHAEENEAFVHGFENAVLGAGHWNPLGHQLVGQHLSDFICRNLE